MKYYFGILIWLCIVIILFITRCDVTCQKTKAITHELRQAQEQQDLINEFSGKKNEYYKLYQEFSWKENKALLEKQKHEKEASNIYWSWLAFGNYAYAWWDEWLDEAISGAIAPVISWSTAIWFTRRVNSGWKSKHKSELCYIDCTFTWVLQRYWLPTQPFIDNEIKYWVKKELAVCIAWADSHLGRALKSTNNIWNVGNNDRWQVVHYKTIGAWIEAMYRVLNNKYLWHKRSVWSLSVWGGGSKPYYATSPENWNNNVLNCLNTILGPSITEERVFRVE